MRFSHLASAALAIAGQVAATPRLVDLNFLAPRVNEEQEVQSLIKSGIEQAKRGSSKSTTFSLEHTWANDETLVKGYVFTLKLPWVVLNYLHDHSTAPSHRTLVVPKKT
jgi:hypothetical protein